MIHATRAESLRSSFTSSNQVQINETPLIHIWPEDRHISDHSILVENDGIDLNAWFKDMAAICYLFGALDWVRDALIPTWGVKMDLL
jgi:hypothetical protein